MSVHSGQVTLVRNLSANLFNWIFTLFVSFFLAPFIVRSLGTTDYGVWSLVAGLLGFLGLLDLGIRQAVNRFVAHHRALDEHDEGSKIISAALGLFTILAVAAVVLSIAIAFIIPLFFNVPAQLIHETRLICILGGVTVSLSLLNGVFGGVITGIQRFDIQCILNVSVVALRAAGTVLVLNRGYGLIGLAIVNMAASMITLLANWIVSRTLYRDMSIRLRFNQSSHKRLLLTSAASIFGVHVLSLLSFQIDVVLIGAMLPIEQVTFYAIAANLAFHGNALTKAMSFLMTPRISALASRGKDQVGPQIVAMSKYAMLLVGPVAVTFMLRGESFIGLWMGPEYAEISGSVLGLLAIVVWQGAARLVIVSSLTGLDRQRILIPGLFAESIANILLSIALIQSVGIIGAALGTVIPSLIITVGYLPRCLNKAAGVPKAEFYRSAILNPVLSCVPFAIGTALIEQFYSADSLTVFFAQVIIVLTLVPVAAWFICFSNSEKRRIMQQISVVRK